jgi:hypothetical protein
MVDQIVLWLLFLNLILFSVAGFCSLYLTVKTDFYHWRQQQRGGEKKAAGPVPLLSEVKQDGRLLSVRSSQRKQDPVCKECSIDPLAPSPKKPSGRTRFKLIRGGKRQAI